MTLLPAPEFHGIVFQRVDDADRTRIPARVEYVVPRPRRTAIQRGRAVVEVIEHVMAALSGLGVDNCLVQLDAPEPPNGDGSARAFVEAILAAGICQQRAAIVYCAVPLTLRISESWQPLAPSVTATSSGEFRVGYSLDYGLGPIPTQSYTTAVTPETFLNEIAFARTFVLESEVAALRAAGLGLRTSPRDLLVISMNGRPLDNVLRADDEFARHKVLDCIGDLALIGGRLVGAFHADRSGHRHNHDMVRALQSAARPMRHSA